MVQNVESQRRHGTQCMDPFGLYGESGGFRIGMLGRQVVEFKDKDGEVLVIHVVRAVVVSADNMAYLISGDIVHMFSETLYDVSFGFPDILYLTFVALYTVNIIVGFTIDIRFRFVFVASNGAGDIPAGVYDGAVAASIGGLTNPDVHEMWFTGPSRVAVGGW